MDTILLNGKEVSENLKKQLSVRIFKLKQINVIPSLAVILVGNDPASKIYIKNKSNIFKKMKCYSKTFHCNENITQKELISLIEKLNNDIKFHGILIQLPLPDHLKTNTILRAVDHNKDVDGFHPFNLGALLQGKPRFIPCTPRGILEIFKFYKIKVSGKHAVIIGRSTIVGKPMFALLAQKFEIGNATVTICHTGTENLVNHIKQADVLIAAVGIPHFVKSNMIKKGVQIIDVGINRVFDETSKKYSLCGDVDTHNVLGIAKSITPVPGGVGPLTITMLLANTIDSAEESNLKTIF